MALRLRIPGVVQLCLFTEINEYAQSHSTSSFVWVSIFVIIMTV